MAIATIKAKCSQYEEENDKFICTGCLETFCFKHLTEHREEIKEEFNLIEQTFI